MTDPTSPGLLLLAYLDTVPTERLLHSGASREEIQQRQHRADELRQQIQDLTLHRVTQCPEEPGGKASRRKPT